MYTIIFLTITFIFLIVIYFVWVVYGFVRYKYQDKKNKIKIHHLVDKGLTLTMAFTQDLHDLNSEHRLDLSSEVRFKIAKILSDLHAKMDLDNVVEIYSMFVHRYILLKERLRKGPIKLNESRILYAAENIKFMERNGYYVLEGREGEEGFNKKYPDDY